MNRILLAICLSLGVGTAFAGQPAGTPYQPQPVCPKAAEKAAHADQDDDAAPAPAATPAPAASRGGGGSNPRLTSPRWHSLLPGMFR